MKIGYFADGPWAHETFKRIINDESMKIVFICVRFDTKDTELIKYAERYNIDLLCNENINCKDFISLIKEYKADIFASMSFNQIFKSDIINLPRYKIINCHAGKLPFYRGRNILNWVLINDEKEFGITVHYVDAQIDTGDIIVQKTYPITDDDDYNTLLNRAYLNCADVLYDALKLIHQDKVIPTSQNTLHPVGFYCSIRGHGDEVINWNQPSRDVFNFIRSICKPGPQARSFIKDKEIKINKVNMIPLAPVYRNTTGQVVGKTDNSFFVKTLDTIVEILEYKYEGKINIGDRLK